MKDLTAAEQFNDELRRLLDENDQVAAQLCQNFKALGIAAYFVRIVDESVETDSTNVRIIGPVCDGTGDVFRRGASLAERYLREKARAN